jgi:predicted small lipoprotein YifL
LQHGRAVESAAIFTPIDRRKKPQMRRIVLSLTLAACLCGCGLKGPLYLPTDKPAQKQAPKPVPPVPATGSGRPS